MKTRFWKWFMVSFGAALGLGSAAGAGGYQPSAAIPPEVRREFRGVWVATVANIDWPSKPGLSTEEQKGQLIAILDRAVRLKLNAVILQVRPACDALYASGIEPWSEYLTGVMGKAPAPYYDPLAFAVEEAHKRGLELHAWFNPYRALLAGGKSPVAANHIMKVHPEFVKRYGRQVWLDPGQPGVREYSLSVVMDVVRRYDIDAVHFDDYFYPDKAESGVDSDFPDEWSWREHGAAARREGRSREDWRRENVNGFIQRVYASIKQAKPWVKFGVSPRGIWRPGYPPQIKGTDAYTALYADSRKWLASGWLDYFAPQLYWPIESKEQSFGALLSWWERQNAKDRHLWPGLNVAKADQWRRGEIADQIGVVRGEAGATGYICYSANSLARNADVLTALQGSVNAQRALVPASPWLCTHRPGKPALFVSGFGTGDLQLLLGKPSQREQTRWWLIQTRSEGEWKAELLPGRELVKRFGASRPDIIAVSRIDRSGVASQPVVLERSASMSASLQSSHEARGGN
jgi:uncharacterized lipoprotein YddW (UPF0748 family)